MSLLFMTHNCKIIFSIQPFVGTKALRTEKERSFLDEKRLEFMQQAYKKLIESAKKIVKRTNSYYISTVDVFDNIKHDIFYDPAHVFVESGNPMVAKRIADEIVNQDILFVRD